MGKMIFTVIGAVAELERSLIRERVLMGLDRARRQGKLCRPQTLVESREGCDFADEGPSLRQIATELKASKDKVSRVRI
jgi:DNA invertase Pin-like site-specific DNA recombinase